MASHEESTMISWLGVWLSKRGINRELDGLKIQTTKPDHNIISWIHLYHEKNIEQHIIDY